MWIRIRNTGWSSQNLGSGSYFFSFGSVKVENVFLLHIYLFLLQDGYGVSLAFSCLLDVVRSISLIIASDTTSQTKEKENQV